MKTTILILIGALTSMALQAQSVVPFKNCIVTMTNGVLHLNELPRNYSFNAALVKFNVKPGNGSLESYIFSGRVVDDNTGSPEEGVAISIHPPGRAARLMGISDDDGAFGFTVWIGDPSRHNDEIMLQSISEGDLCTGGAFDQNRELVSGTVCRYSLVELASTVGGYAKASATNAEMMAAATFAVRAQKKAMPPGQDGQTQTLELVAISSAEQQVVVGMNYRLQLKVNVDGKEKMAEAVVWWQAWRHEPYHLTSWDWK